MTPTHTPTPLSRFPEIVYAGVCYFPRHPDADMHGLVRAVIRTRLFSHAVVALSRYQVEVSVRDLGRTWAITSSAVEQSVTRGRYGQVLVCPLPRAYLTPDAYRPVSPALMVLYRRGLGRTEEETGK